MNPIINPQTAKLIQKQLGARAFTLTAAAAILLLAGSSVSCSTFAGFGRDVEKVGDEIQDAAR